ncbi:hypothetical protein MSAN_02408400 [Mycena sanguinolenta]|uniref:Uncharacterized protein n=1 Tax=Mycena sanguinolenta TaxID=230812 RepID=A0A8H6X3G7_9AGAR|nr:hypothetical protein MSAN_02408400 [Mycena sanguinolenta]
MFAKLLLPVATSIQVARLPAEDVYTPSINCFCCTIHTAPRIALREAHTTCHFDAHEHDSPAHPHIAPNCLPGATSSTRIHPARLASTSRGEHVEILVASRIALILQHTSCPRARFARQSTPHALRLTLASRPPGSRVPLRKKPAQRLVHLPTRTNANLERRGCRCGLYTSGERTWTGRAHTSSRLQFARSAPTAQDLDVAASDSRSAFHVSTSKCRDTARSRRTQFHPPRSAQPSARRPSCAATSLCTFATPLASADTNCLITPNLLSLCEVCIYGIVIW